jgi:hypothetical protein
LSPPVRELDPCQLLNYLETSHRSKAWHTATINDHCDCQLAGWIIHNPFLSRGQAHRLVMRAIDVPTGNKPDCSKKKRRRNVGCVQYSTHTSTHYRSTCTLWSPLLRDDKLVCNCSYHKLKHQCIQQVHCCKEMGNEITFPQKVERAFIRYWFHRLVS